MIGKLRNAMVARVQSVPRRVRMRASHTQVVREPVRLTSGAGYSIDARLYWPEGGTELPAVLLVPGTNDGAHVFEGWSLPVNAFELASMGWFVMSFDPAGRGESWGEEDYGGPEHQDNVRTALTYLAGHGAVDSSRIGVLSISLGLGMACGALAQWPDLPVQWLLDWEGPSDREIITSGGRIMTPALGHSLKDDVYWHAREAVAHVGQLRCGYWRLQANPDHAQSDDTRHASRMLLAAAQGQLPWFQLNHHRRDEVPDTPRYLAGGRMPANRAILSAMKKLQGGSP